jgi:hypothetical protein
MILSAKSRQRRQGPLLVGPHESAITGGIKVSLEGECGESRQWRQWISPITQVVLLEGPQLLAAPIVSAMTAPRRPSGFSEPTVESSAV